MGTISSITIEDKPSTEYFTVLWLHLYSSGGYFGVPGSICSNVASVYHCIGKFEQQLIHPDSFYSLCAVSQNAITILCRVLSDQYGNKILVTKAVLL